MKSPKAPAEDPAAKAARERERRLSELSRTETVMQEADDLTTSLRDVYGLRNMWGKNTTSPPGRVGKPGVPSGNGTGNGTGKDYPSFPVRTTQKGPGVSKTQVIPKNHGLEWSMFFSKFMK